ncbi:MAG: hypothetical protein AB7O24_27620 [Kofleriaceae bacterium]
MSSGTWVAMVLAVTWGCGEVKPITDDGNLGDGPTELPLPPTGVTACRQAGSNRIYWPSVPGAATYHVYASTSAGVTAGSTRVGFDVRSPFTHGSLDNDTQYFYRISAVNELGESMDLSNEVTATPRAYTLPTNALFAATNTANGNTGAIYMWDDWTVSPSTIPDRFLEDAPANATTQLLQPRTGSLFVDRLGALLYVTNAGGTGAGRRVTVYDNVATIDGAVSPVRVLQDGDLGNLRGIYVDTTRNLLYVANRLPGSIVIYDDACNVTGSPPPAPRAVISGDATGLDGLGQISLDEERDMLYIANSTDVRVYSNASSLVGPIATPPDRTLALRDEAANVINLEAYGVSIDSTTDMLYVTHRGTTVSPPANPVSSIFVVHNASAANGSVVVSRTITTLSASFELPMTVHVANNRVFASNDVGAENTMNSWDNASTVVGPASALDTPASPYMFNFTSVFYVP